MTRIHLSIAVFMGLGLAATEATAQVTIDRSTSALQFTFAWPVEAARIPALDRRFRGELAKALSQARASAVADRQLAKQQQRDFHAHLYAMNWTTAGHTPRLLSLVSQVATFEGGAHPMTNYNGLLWDRRLNRQIAVSDLFLHASAFAALTRAPYCAGLDRERATKRQGAPAGLPEFDACPKFSELTVAPVDGDHDQRFDTFEFIAAPYTAGPYVEGQYTVKVPVTARLIAAIKPAYRTAFEAQRRQ
ncbi:MAG: DUF4163 domain-containing protein [Sphingomicrobium sp.]